MISSKYDLFDMIEKLSKQRPFNTKNIEDLTAHSLENMKSQSNEYFLFYKSQKSKAQNKDDFSIKLRVPTSKSSTVDGILILKLSTKMCITQDDVLDKYGEGELIPSDPEEPIETALLFLSYKYDWGDVRYGFKLMGQKCLSSIVLDATQK